MPTLLTQQERFDRLPKWAQDEIRSLDQKVSRLQKQLDSLENKVETDVYYRSPLEFRESNHPIPKGSTVEYLLKYGEKNQWPCRIRVEIRENTLKINADTGIYITPEASNAVLIKPNR